MNINTRVLTFVCGIRPQRGQNGRANPIVICLYLDARSILPHLTLLTIVNSGPILHEQNPIRRVFLRITNVNFDTVGLHGTNACKDKPFRGMICRRQYEVSSKHK